MELLEYPDTSERAKFRRISSQSMSAKFRKLGVLNFALSDNHGKLTFLTSYTFMRVVVSYKTLIPKMCT